MALVVYRRPKEDVNDNDKNGKTKPQRTDANVESGALEFQNFMVKNSIPKIGQPSYSPDFLTRSFGYFYN